MSSLSVSDWPAPPAWRSVDLLSDLHLHEADAPTLGALQNYLTSTTADAVIFLGDVFEVWVGDDCLQAGSFEVRVVNLLRQASTHRPLYFMHGNRDFLFGLAAAKQCSMALLPDPVRFTLAGQDWLLSHGDALCLADTDYMAFRAQVRSAAWQQGFLAKPLAERQTLARQMRAQSEARHKELAATPSIAFADVDAPAAAQWLAQADCDTLVHGHTHKPAEHALPGGKQRIVLSDWDCTAQPPRAEVLRLSASGWQRVALA